MLLPVASVHAVVAVGPAATAAHCATLHAGGHGGCVLEAVEGVLYLLEMLDGVRCVLLRMPEAVEGVHYVLEVLEVMCCALELLEVVFEGRGPRALCAGAAGGDAPHAIGAGCHALCAGGSEGRAGS